MNRMQVSIAFVAIAFNSMVFAAGDAVKPKSWLVQMCEVFFGSSYPQVADTAVYNKDVIETLHTNNDLYEELDYWIKSYQLPNGGESRLVNFDQMVFNVFKDDLVFKALSDWSVALTDAIMKDDSRDLTRNELLTRLDVISKAFPELKLQENIILRLLKVKPSGVAYRLPPAAAISQYMRTTDYNTQSLHRQELDYLMAWLSIEARMSTTIKNKIKLEYRGEGKNAQFCFGKRCFLLARRKHNQIWLSAAPGDLFLSSLPNVQNSSSKYQFALMPNGQFIKYLTLPGGRPYPVNFAREEIPVLVDFDATGFYALSYYEALYVAFPDWQIIVRQTYLETQDEVTDFLRWSLERPEELAKKLFDFMMTRVGSET